MVFTILVLHVVGVFLLIVAAGQDLRLPSGAVFGFGLGITAYTLGMRHAFDADHIAAVDNTTRKLVGEGWRPLSVGFWFSLGHSTVVVGLCVILAFGVRAFVGQIIDEGSVLHLVAGTVGSLMAGSFLLAIGIVNLISLARIVRLFRGMRDQRLDENELENHLQSRGFMARILRPMTSSISRPRQMYPVGLLFGLGFDTATEVTPLALAGGAALTLPWYAILALPVLFTAGMCLFDTIDSVMMQSVYAWAFGRPVRKVYYNLTVTALSVGGALVIGVIILTGLVSNLTGVTGGPLGFIAGIDLGYAGYAVAILFLLAWGVSVLAWRVFHIEERWVRPEKTVS